MSRWELGPILRAMTRNKVGVILIALQIAVTMTIIVNAAYIIVERHNMMQRDSGLDEPNSFYLTTTGFGADFEPKRVITEDLDLIRRTPGVIDAIQINAIPISGGGWSMSLTTETGDDADDVNTANYMTDEHGSNALDFDVIAGSDFNASDVRWRERNQTDWPDKALITKALAESLFPESPWQESVGKTVYIAEDEPVIITGIIDKLQAPWIGWNSLEHAMVTPEYLVSESTRYFIRTEPGQRDRLMAELESTLADKYPNRIIRDVTTLTDTRERSYRQHSAMITILTTVMLLLTLVTAVGIVGLTSFNVNRRKKQIGTRRALGATQGAIIRYFMLENLLISAGGLLLGVVLTIALNMALIEWFSITAMDWFYIPIGIVVLWVVGQLAVLGPALRASRVPPAIATRTV